MNINKLAIVAGFAAAMFAAPALAQDLSYVPGQNAQLQAGSPVAQFLLADAQDGSGNGAHGEVGDNPNDTTALNGTTPISPADAADCYRSTRSGIARAVCPAQRGFGPLARTSTLATPVETGNS